jgi:hypothetical protein
MTEFGFALFYAPKGEGERGADFDDPPGEPQNVMLSSRYRWSLSLSCLHPWLTVVKTLLADAMWQL